MVDVQVLQEMQRLSESKLQLCYVPLDALDLNNRFSVVFNNCRSLHKHFEDVATDTNVKCADVVAVAETRLHSTDKSTEYSIEGFQLIRNDQSSTKPGVRPSHGLALYIKNNVVVNQSFSYNTPDIEFTFLDVTKHSEDKQVVAIYKAPACSFKMFKTTLTRELGKYIDISKSVIFIGDFNIDVSKSDKGVNQFMQNEFHCSQLVQHMTTDYGSILDLVFTNCTGSCETIDAYWSDHKLVYFSITENLILSSNDPL